MCDPKEVFKALPRVKTIWVTKDGNFHLHPNNGGERVDREELNASELDVKEPEQAQLPEQPASEEPEQAQLPEQPAKVQTGRKAYKRHR